MLFSERYGNLIKSENHEANDSFCNVKDTVKGQLVSVMHGFAALTIVRPNRYDNYEEHTTALHLAIQKFKENVQNVSAELTEDSLAEAFTPYLFDVIELQYEELSSEEQIEFQTEINNVFSGNDIPWLLHDGRMIKVDPQQFEQDLKQKILLQMQELAKVEPIFQSAYVELVKAIEFFQKGDYAEAISNAGKSYESVLKILLDFDNENADKLTKKIVDRNYLNLPSSMSSAGFKGNVLMSLPYIRNNSTASHGAGRTQVEIPKSLANLAINLAASLDSYLIDTYVEQKSNEA